MQENSKSYADEEILSPQQNAALAILNELQDQIAEAKKQLESLKRAIKTYNDSLMYAQGTHKIEITGA